MRFAFPNHGEEEDRSTDANRMLAVLKQYDRDGNGKIDSREVAGIVQDLVRERTNSKLLRRMALMQLVGSLLLMAAMLGLGWAVATYARDTSVKDGVLVDRSTNQPLRTASTDILVQDGRLVARDSSAGNDTAMSPVQVAAALVSTRLTSNLPMSVLRELKYIEVNSTSGAQLSLFVLAVSKMPAPFTPGQGQGGYVSCEMVQVYTQVGVITVRGDQLWFEDAAASDVFTRAGFATDASGRRLLGVYEILGFFNFIANLDVYALPPSEPKPHLATNYSMTIKVFEPCVSFDGESNVDRCWSASTNSTSLHGTEVLDGVRYMTTYQNVHKQGPMVLTATTLASYSGMVRKELLNQATSMLYTWQEVAGAPRPFHCSATTYTDKWAALTQSGINGSGITNFTFVGYEEKLGVPARHFILTLKQVSLQASAAAGKPVEVESTAHYWDTADGGEYCGGATSRNNYPVAMDVHHPDFNGSLIIHFINFTSTGYTPKSAFALPTANFTDTDVACPNRGVPRMLSPFDPVWAAPAGGQIVVFSSYLADPSDSALLLEDLSPFLATVGNGTNTTSFGSRHLLAKKYYGLGPCSVTVNSDNLNRPTGIDGSCGGWYGVLTLDGSLGVTFEYTGRNTLPSRAAAKGCLTAGLGLSGSSTIAKWLKQYFSTNIKIGTACLTYNPIARVGELSAGSSIKVWLVGSVSMEYVGSTNFQNCFRTQGVRVSASAQIGSGWFSYNREIFSGFVWGPEDKCSAAK